MIHKIRISFLIFYFAAGRAIRSIRIQTNIYSRLVEGSRSAL